MTSPIRLAVVGAQGRMGARICALASSDPRFAIIAALDRDSVAPKTPAPQGESAQRASELDVIIDFSNPSGTALAIDLASSTSAALLVGTTGLDAALRERLGALATKVAVLQAANTSLGVAVLRHLVTRAAAMLPGWEIDIVEQHHSRKLDAPSGTALALADAIRAGGAAIDPERIHAVRAGDIIGEHVVQFAGPGETLRLEHVAVNRDLFVHGALRAAAWLRGRPAGAYTIAEALGLHESPAGG